jgi:hypothetical protein
MIYSKSNNFIFLKNYKVASTSLEVELSRVLDEYAVVTPITPENILHKPRNVGLFYNHMPYVEIEKIIGKDILSNTESVVFVRNPFDVVLSHMYMSFNWGGVENPSEKDVDNYFNNKGWFVRINGALSRATYTKDSKIMAKHVYKYEDGLDQINHVLSKVNIDNINIQAKEKMYRPKNIKAVDVFNKNQINIIQKDWDWEFKNFGYSL